LLERRDEHARGTERVTAGILCIPSFLGQPRRRKADRGPIILTKMISFDGTICLYSPSTSPSFSFSFLLLCDHSGASSIPSSSSLSPCSFVLCTEVGLCSAGLYTVYKINGFGPVLTNWCCVPAGTIIRSPALTSWSFPAIVALPMPEVKVRI